MPRSGDINPAHAPGRRAADRVGLREHLEALWDERERRIDAQFVQQRADLTSVRAEVAGVRSDVRGDIAAIHVSIEQMRNDVITMKASGAEKRRMRSMDFALVGVLSAIVSAIAAFLH